MAKDRSITELSDDEKDEIMKLRAKGEMPKELSKQFNVSAKSLSQYLFNRKRTERIGPKRKYTKRAHKFIDLPVESSPEPQVAIIVTTAHNLKHVLAGIWK